MVPSLILLLILSLITVISAHGGMDAGGGAPAAGEKNIAKELLSNMQNMFGHKKMQIAFANGVFANGVFNILHSISTQKVSEQLSENYGIKNIQILMFWSKIYELSNREFIAIQRNLLDLKDIQKCVALAIEERKKANKVELLSMFDYVISGTDNQANTVWQSFLDQFHEAEDHHEHNDDPAMAEVLNGGLATDSDAGIFYVQEVQDAEKQIKNVLYMSDEWSDLYHPNSHDHCLYIGKHETHSFFVSGAPFGACFATGNSFQMANIHNRELVWEIQLLHEANIAHTVFNEYANNIRRRRSLIGSGSGSGSGSGNAFNLNHGLCSANVVPNCELYLIISSDHQLLEVSKKLNVSVNLATMQIKVHENTLGHEKVHVSEHVFDYNGPVDDSGGLTIAQIAQRTDFRTFIVNFDKGHLNVGFPGTPNHNRLVLNLFEMEIAPEILYSDAHSLNLQMSCETGTGAVLLNANVQEYFTENPQPIESVMVPINAPQWNDFIYAMFVVQHSALLSANVRPQSHYLGDYKDNEQLFMNHANAYLFMSALMADHDNNGGSGGDNNYNHIFWMTSLNSVTPGYDTGAYAWKFALFRFTDDVSGVATADNQWRGEVGFQVQKIHSDGSSHDITKLVFHLNGNNTVAAALGRRTLGVHSEIAVRDDGTTDNTGVIHALLDGHGFVTPTDISSFVAPALEQFNEYCNYHRYLNEFELILDIRSRKSGVVYLKFHGSEVCNGAQTVASVPLFELDLNCERYVFKPIIMSTTEKSGAVFMNNEIGQDMVGNVLEESMDNDIYDGGVHPPQSVARLVTDWNVQGGAHQPHYNLDYNNFSVGAPTSIYLSNSGWDAHWAGSALETSDVQYLTYVNDLSNEAEIVPLTLEWKFRQIGNETNRAARDNNTCKIVYVIMAMNVTFPPHVSPQQLSFGANVTDFAVQMELVKHQTLNIYSVFVRLIVDDVVDAEVEMTWDNAGDAVAPYTGLMALNTLPEDIMIMCEDTYEWTPEFQTIVLDKTVRYGNPPPPANN